MANNRSGKNLVNTLIAGALVGFVAAPAALADDAGQVEYMNSCASCHGADGKGEGPVTSSLSFVAPPLTGLAAANDGVFPMLDVIHIVDGRTGVRGHGTEAGMPVWGAVYKDPIAGEIGTYGAEAAVRGRILSLAYYLESIQE